MAKRRPQGDGTIRKRPDGRWEGRLVIGHKNNGKPMYKSVFGKTQKEALKLLHAALETYRDVDLTEESRMTLGEWMDKWLDEYMMFTLRENTLNGYRHMVEHQVKRFIGNKPLSALTTAEIQKFYNKIKKEGRVREHPIHGKTLSDSMVRSVHMMLHEALDMAVKERLIVKNPTNGTTVPKSNHSEKQVLGDGQVKIFLDAIQEYPEWSDFFYTEIMTGLRRGEVCGLKWSDVNFDESKLRIERSVSIKKGGGVQIGLTKTDTGKRVITLPPSVIELLLRRREEALGDWIFYKLSNPSEPMNPDAAYRKLKVILKNAGLPLIRFHDLRHTFATQATDCGVDPKTLSGILGHTNASFTLDTYTHVTTDMQKKASSVLGIMVKKMKIGD